jgi:mycothiol synthase
MAHARIEVLPTLPPGLIPRVLEIVAAAAAADGIEPLSEHTLLHLRSGDGAQHLLAHVGAELAGYAHVEGGTAELVVAPAHRRRGVGRALVKAALDQAEGRLRLWAHGDHPAAAALAVSLGFVQARVLLQMTRPLAEPPPEPVLPAGVRLRPFAVGADEAAWVALNNRAFAGHPEQGRWTPRDLELREAEPWFDPAGFLLAERTSDGALLGFHWTKVHGTGAHAHAPIGEVYVLGVDPSAHGTGLGRALTLAGLRHLRSAGLATAMLYVDESNTGAVRLYTGLGFVVSRTDVSFARVPAEPWPPAK